LPFRENVSGFVIIIMLMNSYFLLTEIFFISLSLSRALLELSLRVSYWKEVLPLVLLQHRKWLSVYETEISFRRKSDLEGI